MKYNTDQNDVRYHRITLEINGEKATYNIFSYKVHFKAKRTIWRKTRRSSDSERYMIVINIDMIMEDAVTATWILGRTDLLRAYAIT